MEDSNVKLFVMLLTLAPISCWANETATQLFLAPSLVPEAIYSPIVLAAPGSTTFNVSSVPGASVINDVSILPLLLANPGDPGGFYTTSQLAAINLSNYSGFFSQSPTVDYTASNPGGLSDTVTFNKAGMYYVQLQTDAGNDLFQVLVDTYQAGGPAPQPTSAGEQIPAPPNDGTTIISAGDPDDPQHTTDGNIVPGAMVNAQHQLTNAQTATSVAQVIQDIKNEYAALGNKKFEVNLVGHGFPGGVDIGYNDTIGDPGNPYKPAGRNAMTMAAFQAAIDPYVTSIHFYSCSTGFDGWGQSALNTLSGSIGLATAYTAPVWIGPDPNSFWADTQARLTTSVAPEPASVWMFLIGIPLALAGIRRRK
jgi:hypothetical protein